MLGTGAAKVPILRVSKNFDGQSLSYWLKRLDEKVMDIVKVPTVHRNCGADGGLGKFGMCYSPQAPGSAIQGP